MQYWFQNFAYVVGHLPAGVSAAQVARNFGVHKHTIRKPFQTTLCKNGSDCDRLKSGRRRKITLLVLAHFEVSKKTAEESPGRTRLRVSARNIHSTKHFDNIAQKTFLPESRIFFALNAKIFTKLYFT